MDLEVTLKRGGLGGLDVTSYNDELMKAMKGPLGAGKGAAFTAYQRFRSAQNLLVKAVEDLTDSLDPFTVTIRVDGMKKVYPKGHMLYSAGSSEHAQDHL